MRGNAQPDGRLLGGSELLFFAKLHRIKFACAGMSVVCRAVFRLTISCCFPEIFAIKSRCCAKSRRNFDVFGPILTKFYKSGSPSNMWQSLVTIGQATSEIRQRKIERKKKRKKEDLNYSGKT